MPRTFCDRRLKRTFLWKIALKISGLDHLLEEEEGEGWGWGGMEGWRENSGGNSQGHGPIAPSSRSPFQQRFLNSGVADPRDLGSCVMELTTRQLLVGNLKHPGPHWAPTGT